jgi:MFS family permease
MSTTRTITRATTDTQSRSGRGGALLAVLLMAPFLAQADATIANVATPAIRAGLGASGAEAELVVGGYLIAYAVLLITGARLGQAYGYKRLFVLGVAVFGLASLAAGLAPDAAVLVVMRVLQGAGAAAMYPQTLTGIQLNFAGAARTRAIGLFAIALAVGAVLGQILGGVLVSADIAGASWRPIFLVTTLIGHLTDAVPGRYAPDISGVAATTLQIGGAIGVAGFGSIYLALASHPGPVLASRAFAVTSLVLGGTAVLAAAAAYLATRLRGREGAAA